MNSIEQFWGNNKPQQPEPEPKSDARVLLGEATIVINDETSSQEFQDLIFKLLVEEGEFLDTIACEVEDVLADDSWEVSEIIERYYNDGAKIITNDGEMDSFMIENINRIRNWQMATVTIKGVEYTFSQSPIMKDILFSTDWGDDKLVYSSDDLQDPAITNLIDKYFDR